MHKRLLCVLLAVLTLLSAIPMLAVPASAVNTMKTSEECIAILKEMEGFIKMPMWDHSQYSIGYGSRCDPKDYPNGITEEEADLLLREFLAEMEEDVNKFASKYGIVFAQHQFDALMLFTYNCGTGWTTGEGEFRSAVIQGKTGNAFLAPITLWTTASEKLHLGLLNRRLIEAHLYLNGSYTNTRPASYTYVVLDKNGGEAQARAQGYDSNLYAPIYCNPVREDYRFLGWYTAAEGGAWVTELTAIHAEQTLVAHWQEGNGNPETGIAADYSLTTDDLVSLEFHNVPGGSVKGKLNTNAPVRIVADYVDSKNVKWGKLMNGCWVKLGNPRTGVGSQSDDAEAVATVTVTGDVVNVRSGPGTSYSVVGQVYAGDRLALTEIRQVGSETWGKFRAGWLCLDFTTYDPDNKVPETPEEKPEEEKPEGIPGVVSCKSGLNIRSGPGTSYGVVGGYAPGDKIYILEQKTVDGINWGRTVRGWVSLQYVTLEKTEEEPEEKPEETPEEKPEENPEEPTVPEEPTTPQEPEEPDEEWWDDTHEGKPATVVSNSDLNIRSGAGTKYARVGSYAPDTHIYILEQKAVAGVYWGRTDKGWVCMHYVQLHYSQEEGEGTQGTVVSYSPLNIRSSPGSFNSRVGTYAPGTRITVYEQTTVNGQKWGRTDKGWVCMIYVALDTQLPPAPETPQEPETPEQPEQKPEEPQQGTGAVGTVTASGLNIRSTPGSKGAVVGAYRRGDKVTILEQKVLDGVYWGRTDKGWISLQYVKMDDESAKIPGGFTATVTARSLIIRQGPGTGYAGVGSYLRGTKVTILETTKVGAVLWGRTDKGWICMDYVK